MEQGTIRLKTGLAEMLKGGVIMDVTTPEQAKIAEEAGACAVMALERVPADIRAAGGIARMADPTIVKRITGTYFAWRMPRVSTMIFVYSLSMDTAEASTPQPTYGIFASSNRP